MTPLPHDRRRFRRIATDKPVEVTVGSDRYRSTLLDISLRGLLFACSDAAGPTLGAKARARILLDDGAACIEVAGTVAHVEAGRVGLQYDEMDLVSAERLLRLIELNLGDGALLERELGELVATWDQE